MPRARKRIIVEWGATRHKNIFSMALEHFAEKKKGFPYADFILMNKRPFEYNMTREVELVNRTFSGTGRNVRLLQADFLKSHLKAKSVHELHAHFAFSAPIIDSSGRKVTKGRWIKRYVDRRVSADFSNAERMFSEAARMLRKGGRFVVSDCGIYFPLKTMKQIARAHGFRFASSTRDPKRIAKYSMAIGEMKGEKEKIKKAYLAEFVKA